MTKNSFKLYLVMLKNPKMKLQEMKKALGLKSLTSVQRALIGLEKEGLVKREKYQHRGWVASKIGWLNCPFCERVIDLSDDTAND